MNSLLPAHNNIRNEVNQRQFVLWAAALTACLCFIGCTTGEKMLGSGSEQMLSPSPSTNFDAALKQNQTSLLERRGTPDVALYNIGLILSHPSNPKKDHSKALHAFKTLAAEHPGSKFAGQGRTWIQVLEQQQKNDQERQRLTEEKRALSREREVLLQEKQKLHFASEKSHQIDLEIEKRRRQSLSK